MSRKSRRKRTSFDRNDVYRALLTDTAPSDAPLVFSNDGLRLNLLRRKSMAPDVQSLVRIALDGGDSDYSAPYRYKITKSANSLRPLSLAHPKAQLAVSLFLSKYDHLITYYASRSRFSIRYPARVASTFFYWSPYADLNRYRDARIDAVGVDETSRHPSSYFAYAGHTRYHQFFSSDDFYLLEKRYSRLTAIDISKCFNSIYTHTITWAVQDMSHGKQNTSAVSFGNEFDRLMQRMNYNETNGIAVGAEISRVCAEIVLQSIDDRVYVRLMKLGYNHGFDYDVRRYIDDYSVFSASEAVEKIVVQVIADELSKFNLYLNEAKTERFQRPFQTRMSAVNDALVRALDAFWSQNTIMKEGDSRYSLASMSGRRENVSRSFIRTVKTLCHEQQADYSNVAGFLIAAIDIRIQRLIDSADRHYGDPVIANSQLDLMMCLLEVAFFLYSVSPSVSASSKLARALILTYRFTAARRPDRVHQVSEEILQWSLDFFSQPFGHDELEGAHVPIEQLNVLLALSELGVAYRSRLKEVILKLVKLGRRDYFTIVSSLYIARGSIELMEVTALVESELRPALGSMMMQFRSEDAHLVLDLISCPYLSDDFRNDLLEEVFSSHGLGAIGVVRRANVIADFTAHPWFVRWEKIDLLRMLQRRELNSVY